MSTYGATLSFLRRQNINVQTSEYFPGAKPGERVDGVLNQDVQRTSFPDEYFDLVTSNQVFEHVQDDIAGYRECFRVLKSHGALIFSVPLHDLPETKQLAYHAEDRIVHITPPEYHSSRISGPDSVLTYWHHSIHDICSRVASAGFDVSLVDYVPNGSSLEPAKVIYAVKPG